MEETANRSEVLEPIDITTDEDFFAGKRVFLLPDGSVEACDGNGHVERWSAQQNPPKTK